MEHAVGGAGEVEHRAVVQAVAGQLDGVERRGAGGVEGIAGAAEAEGLGEESGRQAGDVTIQRIDRRQLRSRSAPIR